MEESSAKILSPPSSLTSFEVRRHNTDVEVMKSKDFSWESGRDGHFLTIYVRNDAEHMNYDVRHNVELESLNTMWHLINNRAHMFPARPWRVLVRCSRKTSDVLCAIYAVLPRPERGDDEDVMGGGGGT